MTLRSADEGRSSAKPALAERTGFSREYVNKIEAGKHDLPLSTPNSLARALGVKLSLLVE